jgi:polyhydroxyalkanoate synthesis repressor PhaR
VREETPFEVVDAQTGEDITRTVLTQIIFEQESRGANLFPEEFLRHVIQAYDLPLYDILPQYLAKAMAQVLQQHRWLQEQWQQSVKAFAPPALASWMSLAPWTPYAGGGDHAHTHATGTTPPLPATPADALRYWVDTWQSFWPTGSSRSAKPDAPHATAEDDHEADDIRDASDTP